MKKLIKFLQSQKLMVIACNDKAKVWVANVYFACDDKGNIYFISSKDTKHSQMILKNPNIAFSSTWFDAKDNTNRKGVQGNGTCRPAKNIVEITKGIKLLYKNFSSLRDILTVKWIMNNAWGSKVWVIKPTYIKYWDDEVYGDDESQEFNFK